MVKASLTKKNSATSATNLLVDGSGSMMSRWGSTIENINEFVGSQKSDNADSTIIVTVFGGAGAYKTVYNGSVEKCPTFNNSNMPNLNSMTALLDATVKALNELRATGAERMQLASITDGGENDSVEYRGQTEVVKGLLDSARENEGIDVVALAVGVDAWQNEQIYGLNNTIRATGSDSSFNSGVAYLTTRSMAYNASADATAYASSVATASHITDTGEVIEDTDNGK